MIVIVNGAPDAGQDEVAARLAERFENGAAVEAATSAVASLQEEGVVDFIVAGVFPTWAGLRRFRRELGSLDPTVYAFRLVRNESTLTEEANAVQRRQQREAWEGDVGLPVAGRGPDEAARFIWEDVHEPVEVQPWNRAWKAAFERERDAIRDALGDEVLALEHVGSTAVEGLPAKPIVDMILAVPRLERTCDYLPPLRALGYHFLDYPTNVDRHFFKKGRPRTHHLHVAEPGTRAIEDQVRFRDLLRESPELRARYAALKRELELGFREDRARYSESKGDFIAKALRDRAGQ